jgi:hypothetical protein
MARCVREYVQQRPGPAVGLGDHAGRELGFGGQQGAQPVAVATLDRNDQVASERAVAGNGAPIGHS